MKKLLLILMCLVLMLSILPSCESESGVKVNVYFREGQSNELVSEQRIVDADEDAGAVTLAKLAINELISGPEGETAKAVISSKAKLISLAVNDGVATVNMSKHYSQKTGVDSLILRFAIVNTLCDIDGIDGVVIQVEGKNIVSETTGKEIGVLSMDDIVLNTEDKAVISLYFPDENGEFLERENRKIDAQNAISLEQIVVSELIKGPQSAHLASSVPAETKIISIETKDNVCFLNLSGEFISKKNSGSTATTLALYSVVNSLCDLESVESVQILVNGKAGAEFGNFVLDIPYEANYDLVK